MNAVDVRAALTVPETLRTAAVALYEALEGVPTVPWRYTARDNWPHAGDVSTEDGVVADVHAAGRAGQYLQLVAPPLGAALAQWLVAAADQEEGYLAQAAGTTYAEPLEGDEVYAALQVARTILAVQAGGTR